MKKFIAIITLGLTLAMSANAQVVDKNLIGSKADEARHYIETQESRRSSYYGYYTGKEWGHSASYDLCVNSSRLGLDATVEFIAGYVRRVLGIDG